MYGYARAMHFPRVDCGDPAEWALILDSESDEAQGRECDSSGGGSTQ